MERQISRKQFLLGLTGAGALAALAVSGVEAGEPDKKVREEFERQQREKRAAAQPVPVQSTEAPQAPIAIATPEPRPTVQPTPAPTETPRTAQRTAAAVPAIIVPDLGHPMPTFSPDQMLNLNADQLAKRAVQIQQGRAPNSLEVKFNHYSGEPEIFERVEFPWGGHIWSRTKNEVIRFANWSPWLSRGAMRSPHEISGPKFDQFMKEAFNIPTNLTGELIANRDRVLKDEEDSGGDVSGVGHCYAQACLLALERNWRNGFFNPEMSSVSFTWEELGQIGTLLYSSRIKMRDVNENSFDPGSPQKTEAIRHNIEWALHQAVENNQPIVVEKPLNNPASPVSWWSQLIAVRDDFKQASIGRFAGAPQDPFIEEIRDAARPVDPASIEAKHPSMVAHKSYLTFRDQSALSLYPSLEENKPKARNLLWDAA